MKRSLAVAAALSAGSLLVACATQPEAADPLSALEVEQTWYGTRCVHADVDVPSPEGTKFVLRGNLGCTEPASEPGRVDDETLGPAAAL